MKKFLTTGIAALLVLFCSCNNDDDVRIETDDFVPETEMEGQGNEEEEEEEPEVLFEVRIGAGQVNTSFVRTYYFITNTANEQIGDIITFENTRSGQILRPEGFEDERFNLHQLSVADSSETGESEALKVRINSYLNIEPTSRNFIRNTFEECSQEQEVTYNFGNLPAYDYGAIYNGCNTLTQGAATENLDNSDFEALIPDGSQGYVHLRNGDSAGHFQFFDNIADGNSFSVDESSVSSNMRLVRPDYSQTPSLVRLRKVDPQFLGTVISGLYSFGSEENPDEDFYDFFIPLDDANAQFRTAASYNVAGGGDNVVRYTSIDYIGINGTPDASIFNGTIGFNGASVSNDWEINATGDYDFLELLVESFQEVENPQGGITPVKVFQHRIRTNQSSIDYEKPSIPQEIIDVYPLLDDNLIRDNEFLRLTGQLQDYEDVGSYKEYMDALFQRDGVTSSLEGLFFTSKKIASSLFIGSEE